MLQSVVAVAVMVGWTVTAGMTLTFRFLGMVVTVMVVVRVEVGFT
jgi:hypothetical protein